ncbi:MAG: hypothetical protein LUD27_06980 [Clostridia bacterium]|nr:hypothetical protein [Clostridia bacterium]
MAEEVKSEVKEEKPEKKNFFKTTSFKCIIVLLAIVLVCGILLTICNDLFEVTDEEKLNRAISKIYGYDITVEEVEITDSDQTTYENTYGSATVLLAYKDENGDYLVSSEGTGGWFGTVTCWVLVAVDNGSVTKVEKVVVNTSEGETLLNNIDFLDKYAEIEYTEGFTYSTNNGFVTSGASLSSTAINNAVNGAVSFVNVVCLGKEDQTVVEETLTTGATYSNTITVQAAMFAVANYDSCISGATVSDSFDYTTYIDTANTTYTVDGETVAYSITTTGYLSTETMGYPNAFTLTITVGVDKTIASFDIVTNGSTSGYGSNYASKMYDTSKFVGLGLEDLIKLYGTI